VNSYGKTFVVSAASVATRAGGRTLFGSGEVIGVSKRRRAAEVKAAFELVHQTFVTLMMQRTATPAGIFWVVRHQRFASASSGASFLIAVCLVIGTTFLMRFMWHDAAE